MVNLIQQRVSEVSIPFRADTGFEQRRARRVSMAAQVVSIPFRADTGFEHNTRCGDRLSTVFQSLSGLTLGLNMQHAKAYFNTKKVSIPFRADTGFEQLTCVVYYSCDKVSIPFRADTGFEPEFDSFNARTMAFQSLSGLTLGLNAAQPECYS